MPRRRREEVREAGEVDGFQLFQRGEPLSQHANLWGYRALWRWMSREPKATGWVSLPTALEVARQKKALGFLVIIERKALVGMEKA